MNMSVKAAALHLSLHLIMIIPDKLYVKFRAPPPPQMKNRTEEMQAKS